MSLALNTTRPQVSQSRTLTKERAEATGSSSDIANRDESGGESSRTSLSDSGAGGGGDSQAFQNEAKLQRSDVPGLLDFTKPGNFINPGDFIKPGDLIKPIIKPGIFDVLKPPVVQLTEQEAQLEEQLAAATSLPEKLKLTAQLISVRSELKQEALKELEQFMVSEQTDEDFPSPFVHESGEYTGKDEMSVDELKAIAADPTAPAGLRASAQYLLDNPKVLQSVQTADSKQSTISEALGITDGSISLGDIQASRLEAGDIPNQTEQNISAPGGSYNLTDSSDSLVTIGANNPGKGQKLFDSQQQAVEEAIKTGEPTAFVNQNGDTVMVEITRLNGTGGASYEIKLDDGTSFRVDSEWGTEDTIGGIANVIDWGTTLDVAEGLESFPEAVQFLAGNKRGTAHAQADQVEDVMTFFGEHNLHRITYNHEQAHFIGNALATDQSGQNVTPDGWQEVLDNAAADGIGPVSAYVTNPGEEFAEAVAAYANARDHGPEALADFKAAYPHRAAFLEEHVF